MKQGDIVMIYNRDNPEGQAKLISLIEIYDIFERWEVEFIDQPGITYERMIKI